MMRRYIHTFDSRVSGIPCIVGVLSYYPAIPARYSYSSGNQFDVGPEEPEHVEFELLDRNGRRAHWLEVKMDKFEEERITEEAIEEMRQ